MQHKYNQVVPSRSMILLLLLLLTTTTKSLIATPSPSITTVCASETTPKAMTGQKLYIVKEFIHVLDEEKDYDQASEYLSDDFSFNSPKENFKTKDDWINRFPKFHADAPIFEEPKLSNANDETVVTRKGYKKFGFVTIHLVETFEINDEGKIDSISAARV